MSKKLDNLRNKLGPFTESTFKKLVEGDPSTNHKYVEYLLRSWSQKKINNCPSTIPELVGYIHAFDALLPYIEIEDRDIYSKKYYDISNLEKVIITADEKKEESTFIREEHCEVYIENDNYILLSPKTHRGSLKYGANTKWCTSSKNNPETFDRYVKSGLLCYLINKTDSVFTPVSKVAIYSDIKTQPYSGDLIIYDTRDNHINELTMINGGWDEDEIFKVFMTYRKIFYEKRRYKDSKDYVGKFISTMDSLDFDKFNEHIRMLNNGQDIDFISSITNKFKGIKEKIKQISYGN